MINLLELASAAFKAAREKALFFGIPVMEIKDGNIVETFPNGDSIFVKKAPEKIKVIPNKIFKISRKKND